MKPVLLCLVVFATFLLFSSAAPLDKTFDEFNRISGLDIPQLDKKSVSKKIKPPGKPPGPKLFTEVNGFGFLSQVPAAMLPKITSFEQDNDQKRKKHLFNNHHYFVPLHEEPKKNQFPIQEDGNKDDRTITLQTKNQNRMIIRKQEKMSAALPVNLH